jgi:glycosyltransferase involved in cell wall biosynthesis
LRLAIAGSAWRGLPFDSPFLDRSITLLGHVPDADLRALMASAAALVFPSLHEGFGLPVVEAMTLGLPVITSRRTALPEVGGDAVLYADPESAHDLALQIDRILTQPGLAGELREKGRERARLFRWDTTCAEMMHACAGLMESRPWQGQPVLR